MKIGSRLIRIRFLIGIVIANEIRESKIDDNMKITIRFFKKNSDRLKCGNCQAASAIGYQFRSEL